MVMTKRVQSQQMQIDQKTEDQQIFNTNSMKMNQASFSDVIRDATSKEVDMKERKSEVSHSVRSSMVDIVEEG